MSFSGDGLISPRQAADNLKAIQKQSLLDEKDDRFMVYDLDYLADRLEQVKGSFPSNWKHSIAIKSNPLQKVLKLAADKGFGAEAASFEEVLIAHQAEVLFVIWDSPVKTQQELDEAMNLELPISINANSVAELEMTLGHPIAKRHDVQLGLRINPQYSSSAMSTMNVSGLRSKFGEPIANREAILSLWKKSEGPIGLHIHASSQNTQTQETVEAIGLVYDLATEIGLENILFFDLGGGYPVDYGNQPVEPVSKYSKLLRERCPKLFNSDLPVLTEFGRYYHANSGWSVSRIHEIKSSAGHQTIIQHLGADMFLRESYEPGKWPHRFALLDEDFQILAREEIPSDIAGPLCFGGDYMARDVSIPQANVGDFLLIMDTGANSIALWSKHCSRPMPKIIGISEGSAQVIKQRESSEDAIAFWTDGQA